MKQILRTISRFSCRENIEIILYYQSELNYGYTDPHTSGLRLSHDTENLDISTDYPQASRGRSAACSKDSRFNTLP